MRPPESQEIKGQSAEKKKWFVWMTWFQNRTLQAGINCSSVPLTQLQPSRKEDKMAVKKGKKIKVQDLKPKKDAKGGSPGGNIPGHNIPGHNIPGHNIPGHNIPGHNTPGHWECLGTALLVQSRSAVFYYPLSQLKQTTQLNQKGGGSPRNQHDNGR
jgi:hypothetical protein